MGLVVVVGLLWGPSADEYPELSTLAWFSSRLYDPCRPPALKGPSDPDGRLLSGGASGQGVGVRLRPRAGVRAGRAVGAGVGLYSTIWMLDPPWAGSGVGPEGDRQDGRWLVVVG